MLFFQKITKPQKKTVLGEPADTKPSHMRNAPLRIIIIILFSELLLVGYSFFYEQTEYNYIKDFARFYTPRSLFDFSVRAENTIADSLLEKYLANADNQGQILRRTALSKIGPKKQNIFLTNPDIFDDQGKLVGKALDNFFKALLSEKDTALIRVAHYGDSQLEGDRVSYVVRDKMHAKFGGSGVGYVPLKDINPVSYVRNSSGNWAKYSVFSNKDTHKNYGIAGTVFRFYKYSIRQNDEKIPVTDSIPQPDSQPEPQTISYRNASVSLKMGSKYSFSTLSFLYGHNEGRCAVNIYNTASGDLVKTDTLLPCTTVCFHKIATGPLLNVRVELVADQSPDFYGMYLDGNQGVQVDNYAIRGHSGDGLMLINDQLLKEMLTLTNTRLVIFQYGANMVPYVRSEKACAWLGDIYYKLFMKFKKARPDLSILVIGAGDMAHGSEGKYLSYSWLPQITAAQKQAALKAGCAYWDLYNMMGGANSVLIWAEKNLAVTNGHFSSKGQQVVANEIVEALMTEYNKYIYQKPILK